MKISIHDFTRFCVVCFMNEFEFPFIIRTPFFVLGYWYWVLKPNQEMYVGQRKISLPFWKLETIKSFLIKFEYADGNMKSTLLLVNLSQRVDFTNNCTVWKLRNFTATNLSKNSVKVTFTKKLYSELIWRKIFCMAANVSFARTVW